MTCIIMNFIKSSTQRLVYPFICFNINSMLNRNQRKLPIHIILYVCVEFKSTGGLFVRGYKPTDRMLERWMRNLPIEILKFMTLSYVHMSKALCSWLFVMGFVISPIFRCGKYINRGALLLMSNEQTECRP